MRYDIYFGHDGEMYVVHECLFAYDHEQPSASMWLIPGTHPDDPSFRA